MYKSNVEITTKNRHAEYRGLDLTAKRMEEI